MKFERLAHGAILSDGKEVAHTLQCPHCGGHFISKKGSGKLRTFCLKCMAVTCGAHRCHACIPFEMQLERIEKSYGSIS